MKRLLFLITITAYLSGCASFTPYEDQVPDLSYKSSDALLVSVLDDRESIKRGKPDNFIGVYRRAFGIPVSKTIKDITPSDDRMHNWTLSEFLQKRVVDALQNNGNVHPKTINVIPTRQTIHEQILQGNYDKWIILTINNWYFSTDMHFNTSFNFDTDLNITIYDINGNIVHNQNYKHRDIIKEHSDRHNDILYAYKMRLEKTLNSAPLRNALQN